jgi:hypothetical protein
MKKAKLILAGIACMAVVGGAFAFKATRTLKVFYYNTLTTTVAGGPIVSACKGTTSTLYTPAPIAGQAGFTTALSTTTLTTICPITRLYSFTEG